MTYVGRSIKKEFLLQSDPEELFLLKPILLIIQN